MPIMLRAPLTLTAVALAVLTVAGPAAAVSDGSLAGQPTAGDRLAERGVVVDRSAPVLPDVAAASWLVADLDTGEVLAARDPHGRYAPASTLKTLTALALLPVVDPTRRILASLDDVAVDGSKVGLVERSSYPAGELFAALLMVSGNDAANALASAAGGQAATSQLMNARARELGAVDTVAVNPHGLDAPGQVSSAYDLALFLRAGLARPDFTRYLTTRRASVAGSGVERIDTANKNKLLSSFPGTVGGKNGFTSTARASYVGAAERDGRRLVVALMKSTPKVFDEATKLLDWGFAASRVVPVGELATTGDEPAEAGLPTVPALRTFAPAADLTTAQGSTGLPVTLAGLGLAAAALFSVRHRPAADGPAGRRPGPRVPGRRRTPSRTPNRTPSRTPPVRAAAGATRRPVGAGRD